MAKNTHWSVRADQERIEILEYWFNRNKSAEYSIKLSKLFRAAVDLIAEFPETGRPTKLPFIRKKIVKDYILYYEITPEHIEILTVWDSRRNPGEFKL
jgi:plasmid stabilization system protein ParE